MDGHELVMPVVDESAIRVATSPDGKSRAAAVRDAASGDDAVAVFDDHALVRLVPGGLDDFARANGYSLATDPASARRMVHEMELVTLPLDVESPTFALHRRGMAALVAWSRGWHALATSATIGPPSPGGAAPTTDEIRVFPGGSGVVARGPTGFEYRHEQDRPVTLRLARSAAPALAAVSADFSTLALWDPREGLSLVDARSGMPSAAADTSEPLRALGFDRGTDLSAIGASGAILMFGREGGYGPIVQFWTVYDLGDDGSIGIDDRGVILLERKQQPYEGKFVHCALGEDIVPFESCVDNMALE